MYLTQSTTTGNTVQYSQINITEDSIPIWGQCLKRIENNVILMIGTDEPICYRCFNIKLVSRNILRVLTTDKDYKSKCFTDETKAMQSCPTSEILSNSAMHTEIILYSKFLYDICIVFCGSI